MPEDLIKCQIKCCRWKT